MILKILHTKIFLEDITKYFLNMVIPTIYFSECSRIHVYAKLHIYAIFACVALQWNYVIFITPT